MQLKIWGEKAQAVAEERTKHRAALETELRTLRAAQEELAVKFDNSLTALQTASTQSCTVIKVGVGRGKLGQVCSGLMCESGPTCIVQCQECDVLSCNKHLVTNAPVALCFIKHKV